MNRNWLEWGILVASVVTILALVLYLMVQTLAGPSPVEIRVEPRAAEARTSESGWVLPVTVRNLGGEAAAGVVIEAIATVGGSEEVAEVTVDLLPQRSEVRLAVGFSGPPDDEVRFRIVGYESP